MTSVAEHEAETHTASPPGELAELYAKSLHEIREGEIVRGHIVAVTNSEVLVDIGYKSEGAVDRHEFADPDALRVGDEVTVLLEKLEDEDGMVVLSKRKADRLEGWERIMNSAEEGSTIRGRVTRKVKGGLMVDVGIEAFLPASLATLRGYTNLGALIGQTLDFVVIKMSKARKNIVLSRKDFLLREREEARGKLLRELTVGGRRRGTVKNITDFGAFIDLGGVDGLLHIADMSWRRISHPSEVVKVGENVEVQVLNIDEEHQKISLGLKQLQPSPWAGVGERFPVATRVKGRVVNLMPYGAFVEVEPGIEGLVHISELSWTKRINHPSEVLTVGDTVEAEVLGVDEKNQKLSLGIRQTLANPWEQIAERYSVGSRVQGTVKSLTDYGAFVELGEGIDGLLHNSDLSWTRKINHPSELLKKGQEIEAQVLSCDPESRRIALGLKQLIGDPWPDIASRYPVGCEVDGEVTKVANFGIFVALESDVEGLVHVSETGLPQGEKLDAHFRTGQRARVRVIRIDDTERRIGLSIKGIEQRPPTDADRAGEA